jgi:hypothetical protein
MKNEQSNANKKGMAYDRMLATVANELTEASEIIQHLKAYGMIHTVKGVRYPEGSHDEFIKRADNWLARFRNCG